jgi:hypothetical protein
MDYQLDYNLGTFVLTNIASKSETTISDTEAFDWSARSYICKVSKRADRRIGEILEEMQVAYSM